MNAMEKSLAKSLTVLVPDGLVAGAIFNKIHELVAKYGLAIYLSTMQNIRLLNISDQDEAAIKAELTAAGAELKGPGRFPLARVCVGSAYCTLGLVDTFALSRKLRQKFQGRMAKPKYKIAIAGCPASCSNALITDIGIKATRGGYEVYAGGKGGASPKVGLRIAKGLDEAKVLEVVEALVNFHEQKTEKKQRMSKLVSEPDFPFAEV